MFPWVEKTEKGYQFELKAIPYISPESLGMVIALQILMIEYLIF